MTKRFYYTILFAILALSSCDKNGGNVMPKGKIQLITARIGSISILPGDAIVTAGNEIVLGFNVSIDPLSISSVTLHNDQNQVIPTTIDLLDNRKILNITPSEILSEAASYELRISDQLKGEMGETFAGFEMPFQIEQFPLDILELRADSQELKLNQRNLEISLEPTFSIIFSHEVPLSILKDEVVLVGKKNYDLTFEKLSDQEYSFSASEQLEDFSKLNLLLPSSIGTELGRPFQTVSYELYTSLDTTPKFPLISDEDLLTLIQSQTFKYFWDFGHPVSGLARERNTGNEVVTSGGSGFGLMAMIVAVERDFISRDDALERWEKIFSFLAQADRFHGVWSHWLNGTTGKVVPFSLRDNGGDLVETAFLVQGMLTVRQYLDKNIAREAELIDQINILWEGVEWDWYTRGGQDVLYWHWSPNYNWEMNLQVRGHNETQIIYTLAASSPTHPIDPQVYHLGYARSGGIQNGNSYYGYELPLGQNKGGPLFFAHYSYMGMDPRNLKDQYADYWIQNVNHSKINQAYCIDNPLSYVGYSASCWGLTASDGNSGYSAHHPNNDLGVISPTAAISSIPYTPEESLSAIRHFYYQLGDKLWGEYGFYDAFNPTADWYASSHIAIDQGPIICMIENYRSGLLWDLYMSSPEVQTGLQNLGFTF